MSVQWPQTNKSNTSTNNDKHTTAPQANFATVRSILQHSLNPRDKNILAHTHRNNILYHTVWLPTHKGNSLWRSPNIQKEFPQSRGHHTRPQSIGSHTTTPPAISTCQLTSSMIGPPLLYIKLYQPVYSPLDMGPLDLEIMQLRRDNDGNPMYANSDDSNNDEDWDYIPT